MNRVTYCINCGEKVEYEVKTRPVAICVNGFLFDAIECYAVCTKMRRRGLRAGSQRRECKNKKIIRRN